MKEIIAKIKQKAVFIPVMTLALAGMSMAIPTTIAHADCDTSKGSKLSLSSGANCGATGNTKMKLFGEDGIFTTIINILLFLIGVLSVIMLIYGGMRYVMSQGDAGAVNNAKNTILYAIVGLVVAILAYAIVNFVLSSLGVGDDSGSGTATH